MTEKIQGNVHWGPDKRGWGARTNRETPALLQWERAQSFSKGYLRGEASRYIYSRFQDLGRERQIGLSRPPKRRVAIDQDEYISKVYLTHS